MAHRGKITEREKLACHLLLCHKDPTVALSRKAAMTEAGYAATTVLGKGATFFDQERVQAYLQTLMEHRSARLAIDADRVLLEIAKCWQFTIKDLFDDRGTPLRPHELPDEVAAVVKGYKERVVYSEDGEPATVVELTLVDRVRALELTGKHIAVRAWERDADPVADVVTELLDAIHQGPLSTPEGNIKARQMARAQTKKRGEGDVLN